jgi:hypothetical protein
MKEHNMKIIKYPLALIISLIFVSTVRASHEEAWKDAEENSGRYMTKLERTASGRTATSIYKVGSIDRRFKENFPEGSQEIEEVDTKKRKRIKISRDVEIEPSTQEEAPKHTMAEHKESSNKKPRKAKSIVLNAWNSFDELPQSVDFHNFKKGLLKALNRLATIEKAAIPNEDVLNPVQKKSVDKFRAHIATLTSDHILEHIKKNLVSTIESSVAREDFKRIVLELKDELETTLNKDIENLQKKGISFEGGTYRDYSSHLEYFNATISGFTIAMDTLANS